MFRLEGHENSYPLLQGDVHIVALGWGRSGGCGIDALHLYLIYAPKIDIPLPCHPLYLLTWPGIHLALVCFRQLIAIHTWRHSGIYQDRRSPGFCFMVPELGTVWAPTPASRIKNWATMVGMAPCTATDTVGWTRAGSDSSSSGPYCWALSGPVQWWQAFCI